MDLFALQVNENNEEDTENEDGSALEAFDIRLPATHQYLQSNSLGEISAGSILVDPGSEICVPVLLMDAVLLPGQTLPLQFDVPSCVDFVRGAAEKRQYFALVTSAQEQDMDDVNEELAYSSTGTLFQVQNASSLDQKLTVQAVGRQRCRLLNKLRYVDLQCQDYTVNCYKDVKVVVLEDVTLPSIIYLPDWSLNRLPEKKKIKFFAMLTAHSAHSLKQSSTVKKCVVIWLSNWLQKWFDLSRISIIINQGYTIFSYFVASNLPVALEEKVKLLEEDCTDRRLWMEWGIVSEMHYLACNMCGDIKCELNDLINLSVEANGTHFVNPSGFVHDLFTVNRIENVIMRGMASTEFSWFPGYAWKTFECNNCSSHLGWQFTSRKLLPKKFYGITRKSIKLSKREDIYSP